MLQVKLFKDKIINSYQGIVGGVEDEVNLWLKENDVDIVNIYVSSQISTYTWVSSNSRGEYDHQKRESLFTTILILYK